MAIYAIEPNNLISSEKAQSDKIRLDKGEQEWRILMANNNMYIHYCGHKSLSPLLIEVDTEQEGQEIIKIPNRNCFLFKNITTDDMVELFAVIRESFTEDVWDYINELFVERLTDDKNLLHTEQL